MTDKCELCKVNSGRTHAIRECQSRLDAQVKIENDLRELEQLRIKQAEQAQKDHEKEIAEHAAYIATQKVEQETKIKLDEANAIIAEQKEKERLEKEKKEKTEAEENARIADAEYRQRVIEETIQSFIDYGFDEGHSEQLAIDIAEGNIKNVFIKF